MFGLFERRKDERNETVALIGDCYRRDHVKRLLAGRVNVEAELASTKRVYLLSELSPNVVVLDCVSEGVNPFVTLPELVALDGAPRVVALTDGRTSVESEAEALISLGADATADIHDAAAVVEVVLQDGVDPTPRARPLAAA